ncbi:MAG: hypothetical protein HOP22_07185 [Nitrospiraceae bacterium]|nr:hypothetical protein [Nitrospiraceae bacterium]
MSPPQLLWYNSTAGQGPSLSGGHGSGHPNDIGLGDTTIYLKTRHRIQDPDSWKGSFTTYHGMSLPTSQWFGTDTFGTHPVPGGFAPLGRLPATKFGGALVHRRPHVAKEYRAVPVHGVGVLYLHSARQHRGHHHV